MYLQKQICEIDGCHDDDSFNYFNCDKSVGYYCNGGNNLQTTQSKQNKERELCSKLLHEFWTPDFRDKY